MSRIKLKIRPTVLLLILFLVGISVVTTLGIQYFNSKDLAHSAVLKYVKHNTQNTQVHLHNFNKANFDLISMLKHSQNIKVNPSETQNIKLIRQFTTGIKNNPFIYAIYTGFENGDFYEVINLNIDNSLRIDFNSRKDELWLVVKIFEQNGKRIRLNQFLDKNLNILRTVEKKVNYTPVVRPWYKRALKSDETIVTSPYQFTNLNAKGLTYAKKLKGEKEVVLGVDVSLKTLSSVLASNAFLKKTQIYLYDKDKNIIASNLSQQNQPTNIHNILLNNIKNKRVLTIDKEEYFVSTCILDNAYSSGNYLSILISEDEVLAPFNEKIIYSIVINIMLLFLVLPLIWYGSRLIVSPIQDLQYENEKVRNLNFEDVKQIKTPIRELSDLSKSFVSMSKSIHQYEESLEELMDSFIKLIASAIDAKSDYTGGHCRRVPELTLLLAQKASLCDEGIFKDFTLDTKDEIRELTVASWLHDCGKVTTPVYVVDKAVKLETIYNRIHEIRTRFEVIYRDLIIQSYEKIENGEDRDDVNSWLKKEQRELQEEFEFIANANIGGEFMNDKDILKVKEIGKRKWRRYFDDSLGLSHSEQKRYVNSKDKEEFLLSDKKMHIIPRKDDSKEDAIKYNFKGEVPKDLYNLGEIYNLCIEKGTLTTEERYKIDDHINMTIKMLEELPFPDNLKRVPEYASAHHETLIGTGYPRKLTKDQMSIPARIMAVSDVFEALTASDRPYKKAKTLSESIKIISYMVKDKHLDEDIFRLFLESKVYLEYANEFLEKEQIDEVNIEQYIK